MGSRSKARSRIGGDKITTLDNDIALDGKLAAILFLEHFGGCRIGTRIATKRNSSLAILPASCSRRVGSSTPGT